MAVFTAAVTSVAALVTGATAVSAATVAAAAVTVSTAIGVAGLAVTAVGMVTKNESLMKAGKIMGYVGLAGGLAGGAIGGFGAMANGGSFVQGATDAFAGASQHIAKGWDEGVGSFFSGGDKIAGPIGGGPEGIPNGINNPVSPNQGMAPPTSSGPVAPTDISGGVQEELGRQAVQGTQGNLAASQANAGIAPSPATPIASTPDVPIAPSITNNPIPGYVGPGASPIPGAPAADAASKGLFSSMPEWAKYSMMTTAGQGVSGLASGYFTGLSAEEQLKQKQLENQQTQNQIQLLNRQGSYAPLIQFRGPGLANSGGR